VAAFDVAEFVPWILTLALLPLASIRPWLKAVMAVLSVPYSMLAFTAGELFVGCALGNCLDNPGSANTGAMTVDQAKSFVQKHGSCSYRAKVRCPG